MADTDRHRISLRPAAPADAEATSRICFEAFGEVSRRHNFPPDFAGPEVVAGLMGMMLQSPFVWGVVAEHEGRVVGSNFLWEWEPVAGLGPVTVDPSAQKLSVGRLMMEAVMGRARERRFAGVRLVQAGYNTRSLALYAKLGFDVRELLVCLNGEPVREHVPGHDVRPATRGELATCADLCRRVHGHDRTGELSGGIERGAARVVEQDGRVVAYTSELGFFGHCVALTNDGLRALIGAGERISGPGMLLPSHNGEVFRWCLSKGLKHVQPMTLMSHGLYNEPRGAFLPSILY